MKKLIVVTLIAAGLVTGVQVLSFASDWDKAGKVLAVFEGLRVLTGGKADIIGTVTGINRPREQARDRDYGRDREYGRRDDRPRNYSYEERIWIPNIVWEQRYVPEHYEYRPGHGQVFIGGHYETCQVERGGHWEARYARR